MSVNPTHPYASARVAVLLGGLSSERSVSLTSGKLVVEALQRRGFSVVGIDVGRDLGAVLATARPDVCFIALHGTWGEDGCIQGLLELAGIPYTGSGPLASAVAFDKERTKRLMLQAGLPSPKFVMIEAPQVGAGLDSPFGYPVVVKPVCEGSSVGVTIVHAPEEYEQALVRAATCGDGRVMVEQFIDGTEATVGLLDGVALGSTEIVPAETFYDFNAKYESDATRYFTPARQPAVVLERMHQLAEQAVAVLGCGGAPRVDFVIDRAGAPWLLEVNTLPGMTTHSLLPMCARLQGIEYDELCERILAGARLWVGQADGAE